MVKVGVLGLQGAVREHVRSIEASGAEAVVVKRAEQLNEIGRGRKPAAPCHLPDIRPRGYQIVFRDLQPVIEQILMQRLAGLLPDEGA